MIQRKTTPLDKQKGMGSLPPRSSPRRGLERLLGTTKEAGVLIGCSQPVESTWSLQSWLQTLSLAFFLSFFLKYSQHLPFSNVQLVQWHEVQSHCWVAITTTVPNPFHLSQMNLHTQESVPLLSPGSWQPPFHPLSLCEFGQTQCFYLLNEAMVKPVILNSFQS